MVLGYTRRIGKGFIIMINIFNKYGLTGLTGKPILAKILTYVQATGNRI